MLWILIWIASKIWGDSNEMSFYREFDISTLAFLWAHRNGLTGRFFEGMCGYYIEYGIFITVKYYSAFPFLEDNFVMNWITSNGMYWKVRC